MSRTVHRGKRISTSAWTLIELLIVALIIATLMAVAIPLYLSAVNDSQKKTCRANLQTIANTVQAAKTKALAGDYSAYIGKPINTANEQDLLASPVCPSGGAYSLINGSSGDATTFKVSCTKHGTFEPGVDSN